MDDVFIEPRLDFINDNPNRKLFSVGNKKYLASMIRLASYNDLCIFPIINGDVFYSTILYRVHLNEISKDVLEYHIQRFCEQQKYQMINLHGLYYTGYSDYPRRLL